MVSVITKQTNKQTNKRIYIYIYNAKTKEKPLNK